MGCVYIARNRVNNKRYVGKTVKLLCQRMSGHVWAAKRNRGNMVFHKALNKYGQNGFEWTVLFEGDDEKELGRVERAIISMLRTQLPFGYNTTAGGEGLSGYHHSETTRAKIAAIQKGRKRGPHSPEHAAKIAAALIGKKHSAERCEKNRISRTGRKASPETRAKHTENLKRRWQSKGQRQKFRATMKGRKLSPEHRQNIGESWKRRKATKASSDGLMMFIEIG